MPPSLYNPLMKIARAKEHLDVLDGEARAFIHSAPPRITPYIDAEQALYTIRLHLVPPPIRLGILAGDAIDNLRSALDHLVWQLALLTTSKPFRRTEFPIFGQNGPKTMGRLNIVMQDIPSNAVNEIKALQPYHRQADYKADYLWKLDELCNISKHRVIPLQAMAWNWMVPKGAKPGFDARDNSPIVSMDLALKAQMDRSPLPQVEIVLGSEVDGITIPLEQLGQIYEYVAGNVFPRFKCFFPNSPNI